MSASSVAVRLLIALGIGLLIGAERERRKGEGPQRGAAGIRTFAIVALLGALGFHLGGLVLLVLAMVAIGSLAVLSYLRTRDQDPGMTTESALLVTLVLGGLAMREPAVASGVAVIVAILLASRRRMHQFVRSVLTEQELHDALTFAAAVVVVLPLMPNRYLGPFGAINPRVIWKIVVLMMSVSAAGYVAVRTLGAKYGLPLAALASGFASSTATVAAMAAKMKEQPALARAASAGAVLATIGSIIELAIVIEATNRSVLLIIKWPLVAAILASILYGGAFTFTTLKQQPETSSAPGSAFDPKVTLILTATIAAVLLLSAAVNAKFGKTAVVIAAAIAGFADAHSAAVSVTSLVSAGKLAARDAVLPVFAGLTTNTLTKATLAFTAGGPRFAARVVPGLAFVIAALWATWLLLSAA